MRTRRLQRGRHQSSLYFPDLVLRIPTAIAVRAAWAKSYFLMLVAHLVLLLLVASWAAYGCCSVEVLVGSTRGWRRTKTYQMLVWYKPERCGFSQAVRERSRLGEEISTIEKALSASCE